MDLTSSLQSAEDLLNYWTRGISHIGDDRLDVNIPARELVEAVAILRRSKWGYLSAVTGLDHPAPVQEGEVHPHGSLEILYHFTEGAAVVTLRVSVPYERAVIPSVCAVLPYATLYERELMELFGIQITGTPNTDRLILPDDWPDGIYPMRKSFVGFGEQAKNTEQV